MFSPTPPHVLTWSSCQPGVCALLITHWLQYPQPPAGRQAAEIVTLACSYKHTQLLWPVCLQEEDQTPPTIVFFFFYCCCWFFIFFFICFFYLFFYLFFVFFFFCLCWSHLCSFMVVSLCTSCVCVCVTGYLVWASRLSHFSLFLEWSRLSVSSSTSLQLVASCSLIGPSETSTGKKIFTSLLHESKKPPTERLSLQTETTHFYDWIRIS